MKARHSYKIILVALVLFLVPVLFLVFSVEAKTIEIQSGADLIGVQSSPVSSPAGGSSQTPLPVSDVPAPLAPEINVAPEIYYPLDETLYIEGKADPKSKVELFFEKPGSNPVRLTVDANSGGGWFLSQKLELASGEWMVRARISFDPPSDWSNPRIIQSRVTGFVVGGVRVKYAPIAIVLILLFLLGGGFLLYAIMRARSVRIGAHERELQEGMEKLQKELRLKDREAAEVSLEQHFGEIRNRVLKELEHLESRAKKNNKLSGDEEAHRSKLLRELREAEDTISKKVKEIR
ncbi:MAG: hypothetical protein Q8L47_00155 [bacterium]|nr:hypothetical protein [bacterium]